MLTSTAAEQKYTVAVCQALCAQITRSEEAFIQLHGRPPKGAVERAILATTYEQFVPMPHVVFRHCLGVPE
eukprot:3126315-Ditylum_brightwellii.AAC.2